jgi:hypothetical protein
MDYTEEQTSRPIEHINRKDMAPVISLGEWIGTLIIMVIPLLNIIMLIVWLSESSTNPNKVNWAKATLILIGIQIVFASFFLGTIIGTFSNMMSSFGQNGLW